MYDFFVREMDTYSYLGWKKRLNTNSVTGCVLNSHVSETDVPESAYIEDCRIKRCRLGEGVMLSNIDVHDTAIPAEVVMHGLELKNGEYVCRIYGREDNPKSSKDAPFLGSTISKLARLTGISNEAIWGNNPASIWNARIYPICKTMQDAVESAIELHAILQGNASDEVIGRWSGARKTSLAESFLEANVEAILERQETIRDQDGQTVRHAESEQKMRPDIIVHYPDEKDVVIDSKVSLTAYVDYMNAEDEGQRRDACARHVKSVKAHVEELARKDYSGYLAKTGRQTVDFVIMFIPNEGPFHLAMISEPTLWNTAFLRKVLIVSPVNLMALLKIIHIAWTRDEQNRNQQAILETASEMLDRLYAFYSDFDEIGKALNATVKKFETAEHRLKQEGRNRSVVLSGEKLKRLGVRLSRTKELPLRFRSPLDEENISPSGEEALPFPEEADTAGETAVEAEDKPESAELF